MTIDVAITRKDVLLMQLALLPKFKRNWIGVALIFIVIPIILRDIPAQFGIHIWLITSFLYSSVGAFVLVLFTLIYSTFLPSKSNDMLGPATYTITAEGFREQTRLSTMQSQWQSIRRIYRSSRAIYVLKRDLRAHIIPERAFPSRSELDEVFRLLSEYVQRD